MKKKLLIGVGCLGAGATIAIATVVFVKSSLGSRYVHIYELGLSATVSDGAYFGIWLLVLVLAGFGIWNLLTGR